MQKACFLIIFLLSIFTSTVFAKDTKSLFKEARVVWAKSIGEHDPGRDQVDGVSIDPWNNTIISGVFVNELFFGESKYTSFGEGDLFLASINPEGKLNWFRHFGSIGDDNTYDLTTDDSGNIYLSGWFSETLDMDHVTLKAKGSVDQFLAKFSKEGKLIWARSFGGLKGDGGNEIAVLPNGEIAVSGITEGDYQVGDKVYEFGGGRRDSYVLRLDTNGNVLWVKPVNGLGTERIRAMMIDLEGNVFVGFQYRKSVSIEGQEIKSRGDWDGALAKLGPNGDLEWLRPVGAAGTTNVSGAAVDSNGNVYASGIYSGDAIVIDRETPNFGKRGAHYLAKISPEGKTIWLITLTSKRIAEGVEIVANEDGPIISGFLHGKIEIKKDQKLLAHMQTPEGSLTGYAMGFDKDGQPRFVYMPTSVGRKSGALGGTMGLSRDGKYIAQSIVFQNKVRFGKTLLQTEGHRDGGVVLMKIK